VESEDLALPPVVRHHVGEHAQQVAAGGLGDKRRMIQGMHQFSQAGRPETVVPGKERLGNGLVGGLPRPDLHRINITARRKARKPWPPALPGEATDRWHSRSGMSGNPGCCDDEAIWASYADRECGFRSAW
jgi:hypothetical protein